MLHKFLTASCVALLFVASTAYAGPYDDTTFNAGVELSFVNKTSYNNGSTNNVFKASDSDSNLAFQKNEPGVNVELGARFTEHWGGQFGFSFIQTASSNVQNGERASSKISNIFLDLLGFINVAQQVDMMGLVGYGMLKCNPSVTNTYIYNQSSLTKRKLGIRAGGGFQYNFMDQWSTRVMLVYQKGNPIFLQSLFSVSIGLFYTFY